MIGLEPRPMLIVSLGVTAIRPRDINFSIACGTTRTGTCAHRLSALSRHGRAPLYRPRLLWSSALRGRFFATAAAAGARVVVPGPRGHALRPRSGSADFVPRG